MENKPEVRIILEGGRLPEYKNPGDAGADVRVVPSSHTEGVYLIQPGKTVMLSLGFRMAVPNGWEMQVRSRSGLSKKGVIVANAPGTIDSGYRGPCMVLLHNQGPKMFVVQPWDRVAQFVLKRAPQADFVVVDELDTTVRGEGGFGSTGTH